MITISVLQVIARAVLYFTGEAFDEDDEDYEAGWPDGGNNRQNPYTCWTLFLLESRVRDIYCAF